MGPTVVTGCDKVADSARRNLLELLVPTLLVYRAPAAAIGAVGVKATGISSSPEMKLAARRGRSF